MSRVPNWIQVHLVERLLLRRARQTVYQTLGGHIFFQTLSAAIQLELFSVLNAAGKMTREEIARSLKCADQPIRILLLGCVTLGLLRKRGEYYSNSRLSKRLFVKDSRENIIDIVRWQHYINYRAMYHFGESIRAGTNVGLGVFPGNEPTLYERLAHDRELETIFQAAMHSLSRQANEMLARNVDLSRTQHLLDVGGGDATNIMTLARRFPHLRATVFDSPTVCTIAQRRIEEAGMTSRLGVVAGDCFKDPFPAGVDTILFGHFFTIWSPSRNQALLRKAYESVPRDGSVIIFNMMQRDTEDGPYSAAMGSPYFLTLATGEGMLYTWKEYVQWMRAAGFTSVTRHILPRDHGLVIGRKG